LVLFAFLLLAAIGCQGGGEAEPAADAVADASAAEPAVHAGEHVHALRCGCAIEEIGTCGNYIEIDGEYVELVPPKEVDLGVMAFCGRDDLTASVQGEIEDGKFVATSFEYTK
jgi:hypothetical protein